MIATVSEARLPIAEEIHREHLLRLLRTMLDPPRRIITVEGEEGIGKSTLLRQFAVAESQRSVTLFVSSASTWAYSPQVLRRTLCAQIEEKLAGEPVEIHEQIDDTRLSNAFLNLDRRARRDDKPFYFVVDGLDELPPEEELTRRQILGILPFGFDGFRFLFAGSPESFALRAAAAKELKAYPLAYFTREETERFLKPLALTSEQLTNVYQTTRGVPGHLAAVRRVAEQYETVEELLVHLPEALPDLFRLEWRVVQPDTSLQARALAILAHEPGARSAYELAALTGGGAAQVVDALARLRFVEGNGNEEYQYVSEAFRRFAAGELRQLRGYVSDAFIELYAKQPDSDAAMTRLSTFFLNADRLQELVQYLSPERFAKLYKRTGSLRLVQQKADEGIEAATKLKRQDEVVRFTVQRCTLAELARSRAAVAEVCARTVAGDYATALALAEAAPTVEARVRLLASVARVRRESELPSDPELDARIRDLVAQLGDQPLEGDVVDLASDLFYSAPDLALELVNRRTREGDRDNALDWSLLHLQIQQIQAQGMAADVHAKHHTSTLSDRIQDPAARRLSRAAIVILGRLSAEQAINEVSRLEGASDQLYVLQHWMLANRDKQDAARVLDYALDRALDTHSHPVNARAYRELATCLPYLTSTQETSYYLARFDAQRQVLARVGPPEDYVRLQLLLARAEWRYDRAAAEERFAEVYNSVSNNTDLAARTAGFASLLAALTRADPERTLESSSGLHTLAAQEVASGVDRICEASAEHFEALVGVIEALAVARPDIALAVIQQMNTEWRRDSGYGATVRAICALPMSGWDVDAIQQATDAIVAPELALHAYGEVAAAVGRSREINDEVLSRTRSLIRRALAVRDVAARLAFAADCVRGMQRAEAGAAGDVLAECERVIRMSWETLPPDWEKLDIGYRTIASVGRALPALAAHLVGAVNELKERLGVADSESAAGAVLGLRLAVRAFGGIVKRKLDSDVQFERLLRVAGEIGSTSMQVDVLTELALRCYINGRKDRCSQVVERHIVPALQAVPDEDITVRQRLTRAAAAALYAGAANTALTMLLDLPSTERDEALSDCCWFLLTNVPRTDPYDWRSGKSYNISYETANGVLALARHLDSDSVLFGILQALVESAAGDGGSTTINRAQRATIRQETERIRDSKFPAARFIKHEGYVIALDALLNKLREPGEVVPVGALAARARLLPNFADRVYVLALVGANARSAKERHACFDEAKQIADSLPMLSDRIDRLQTLSELCADQDVQRSKDLLREAITLSYQGTGRSFEERRESLLASARRIGPEFASSIATLSDDDPAKRRLSQQLEIYRKRDSFVEQQRAPSDSARLPTLQDARMFWMLLGSLNAGTIPSQRSEKALVALREAAEFPITDAYPFFAWFLENAVRRSYNDADVRDYIIPLHEACLRGAELAMHAAAGAPAAAQRMLAFADAIDGVTSVIVGIGERSEGIERLLDWLRRTNPESLSVSEPYFRPESVQLLALIAEVSPECEVVVIAGKKESQTGVTGSVAEAYRSAWTRQFATSPPNTRLIFAETRKSRKFPIHDRWWLSNTSGVDLGTSFNGIGLRISSVRVMEPAEVEEARQKLAPYFAQSRHEVNGERLDYESYTL